MIGTPTVCINGNNLPICNASLDESIVTAICMQFTGLTSMLIIIGINNFIKNRNASNMHKEIKGFNVFYACLMHFYSL